MKANIPISRFLLLSILIGSILSCKPTSQSNTDDAKVKVLTLKQVFDKKNEWLVAENFDSLKQIIHPQIKYAHSNCWVQVADDMINPNNNDSLVYLEIDISHLDVDVISNVGIVEGTGHFKGIVKRDSFDLNLCFVETYIEEEGSWKLIARQSSKAPK
jgi:hypothetical protein